MGDGERVLEAAVAAATTAFGPRLLAAYALGSLAHGGFAPLDSDVDLGLVLADPLADDDGDRVAGLHRATEELGELGGRLSVFWGSPSTLAGAVPGGRFPGVDRLDLVVHGRLLVGNDHRSSVALPTHEELVAEAGAFARERLGPPPPDLARRGAREITKRVLFPVRFLYTHATGEIGRNDDAVDWYLSEPRAANELVAAARRWRVEAPTEAEAGALLDGLAGLDRELAEVYGL